MKRKFALVVCLLLLITGLLTMLASCGSAMTTASLVAGTKDKLTVTVPRQVIYADSDGYRYYVSVQPNEYLHYICGVHSFTSTPPKKLKGYTISLQFAPTQEEIEYPPHQVITTSEQETFPYQWEREASAQIAHQALQIYDRAQISGLLQEGNLEDFLRHQSGLPTSNYRNNGRSYIGAGTVQLSEEPEYYQQLFLENKEKEVIIPFTYTYTVLKRMADDTLQEVEYQRDYITTFKLETFTCQQVTTETYVFSQDYTMIKTPYYERGTNKLVAYQVQLSSGGMELTFIEYQ